MCGKITGFATAIAVLSVLLVCLSADARMIPNGGFELPILPVPGYQQLTPTAWIGGRQNLLFKTPPSDPLTTWPLAYTGEQYATPGNANASTGQAYLYQDFNVDSPGPYAFTWYANAGHSGGFTTSPYVVTISQEGQPLFSRDYDAYSDALNWNQESVLVDLGKGSCRLAFTGSPINAGLNPLIDDVSANVVPEPAAMLAAAAILGLAVTRPRRHR